MACRRIISLFCLFGYTHSSIWLSPGGILFVFPFPLIGSGSGLVVLLQVLEGKMTAVSLSWSSSSCWIIVFATGAILSWLIHFSHGMGGLLLGLSQNDSRPSAVRSFESDCAMLY